MPPEEDPLPAEQIALIARWIDQGAHWPAGIGSDIKELPKHWAYVKPVKSALPPVSNPRWPRNAIDHFILSNLDMARLAPSAEVDRERLIRRVYLDLIGLPPTVEEVDQFLQDQQPDAYDKLVERALASPQYGVRWARPWLDMARYADSNGFQRDGFRSLWPYRDWVIQAMNDDLPFDQFTIAQLAGDLIPNATLAQKIATGFHRCTTVNVEAGAAPALNRVNQVIDRVNTTATVWLGSTLECVQCHNHKYDPFRQREYYQLFSFFNNTPVETALRGKKATASIDFTDAPSVSLPLPPGVEAKLNDLSEQFAELQKEMAERQAEADKKWSAWDKIVSLQASTPLEWHVLKPASFQSEGGVQSKTLDDNSLLFSGPNPDKDTFTITTSLKLSGVTGFKLEALTHADLPGKGPGRRSETNPNFVLTEFKIFRPDANGQPQPVKLVSPQADINPVNFHVARSIDDSPLSGWGIHAEFGKPHWATYLTEEPLNFEEETTLTFRLEQNYGGNRTLGRVRLLAMTGTPEPAALPPHIAKIVAIPEAKRSKAQINELRTFHADTVIGMKPLREAVTDMSKKLESMQAPTSLVMEEMEETRLTFLFKRGNFLDKGEEVPAGVPAVLNPLPEDAPRNRLGLAQWIASKENPLTARVAGNRWWAEIFGQGLVGTPEDFGTQGDRPTHPQLLDWLAVELMEQGWSMKHIHRLMVTSATYRQASRITPRLLERDPTNRLYARGPRFRLPAETIRDNALAISGLLSTKLGGPPVYPPQPAGIWRVTGLVDNTYRTSEGEDRFRRGVYTIWRRSAPPPGLQAFDAPDRASCVVQRPRTNTPLQALTLMNSPDFVEMTQALSLRLATHSPTSPLADRLTFAFRLCVSRHPTAVELQRLEQIYQHQHTRFTSEPTTAEALLSGMTRPSNITPTDLATWFYLSQVLLNLDETINK